MQIEDRQEFYEEKGRRDERWRAAREKEREEREAREQEQRARMEKERKEKEIQEKAKRDARRANRGTEGTEESVEGDASDVKSKTKSEINDPDKQSVDKTSEGQKKKKQLKKKEGEGAGKPSGDEAKPDTEEVTNFKFEDKKGATREIQIDDAEQAVSI